MTKEIRERFKENEVMLLLHTHDVIVTLPHFL
jgi:hypothetical protein